MPKARPDFEAQLDAWEHQLDGGWTVLAGRTDRDKRPVEPARRAAERLWFHVKGMPGSHVVLRTEGRDPDRTTLEAAAAVAAYYSKARSGGVVAVNGCLARFVSKPRGAKPGTVEIRKDRVFKVRPRLPDAGPEDP